MLMQLTGKEHNELLITKYTDLSILHNEDEWVSI